MERELSLSKARRYSAICRFPNRGMSPAAPRYEAGRLSSFRVICMCSLCCVLSPAAKRASPRGCAVRLWPRQVVSEWLHAWACDFTTQLRNSWKTLETPKVINRKSFCCRVSVKIGANFMSEGSLMKVLWMCPLLLYLNVEHSNNTGKFTCTDKN